MTLPVVALFHRGEWSYLKRKYEVSDEELTAFMRLRLGYSKRSFKVLLYSDETPLPESRFLTVDALTALN